MIEQLRNIEIILKELRDKVNIQNGRVHKSEVDIAIIKENIAVLKEEDKRLQEKDKKTEDSFFNMQQWSRQKLMWIAGVIVTAITLLINIILKQFGM